MSKNEAKCQIHQVKDLYTFSKTKQIEEINMELDKSTQKNAVST